MYSVLMVVSGKNIIYICVDDLKLLDNLDSFANSLNIFDDMGENIRLPAIDSLYSKGRHHNMNIICVGHSVTDLNTKARDNTPAIYIYYFK